MESTCCEWLIYLLCFDSKGKKDASKRSQIKGVYLFLMFLSLFFMKWVQRCSSIQVHKKNSQRNISKRKPCPVFRCEGLKFKEKTWGIETWRWLRQIWYSMLPLASVKCRSAANDLNSKLSLYNNTACLFFHYFVALVTPCHCSILKCCLQARMPISASSSLGPQAFVK